MHAGSFSAAPIRTVQATYIFQTTNANISGGLIHVYKTSSTNDLCIDAGSGSPVVGTAVTVKTCSAASSQQTWAYNSNLTIELTSSVTTAQAERFAHQVLQLKTSEEIRAYLTARLHEISSALEVFDSA